MDGVIYRRRADRSTFRKGLAAVLQRRRDGGQIQGLGGRDSPLLKEGSQVCGGAIEGRVILRRQVKSDGRSNRRRRLGFAGKFLQHHMGIGSADAERADPGAPRLRPLRPSTRFGEHVEG